MLSAPAFAGPHGIAGPSVGFGGILGDQGFVGGEYDFAAPPYFSWGPEAMVVFGGGVSVLGGVAARFYIVPDHDYLVQPYLPFGGGGFVGFPSGDGDTSGGGYLHFGGGIDFDIEAPVVPYVDMGGIVFFSDGTGADFKIELGVRFP